MTAFYEKFMAKRNGIEFVRTGGIVAGCQNADGLVRCPSCDYIECPMRGVA